MYVERIEECCTQAAPASKSAWANAPTSASIGVEGDSLADLGVSEPVTGEEQQNQFVDAVETILKSNDTDDLRGTFKKVNSMRDQQGEVAPSTLYYHKMGGN